MRLPVTVLFSTLLLLAAGALTGCAGSAPVTTAPSVASAEPGARDPGSESEAVGLINLWRVTGAAGETADTWLRIDAGEMLL